MTTLRKNIIYNIVHHFLTIILPFIVVPYVSRVLTADMIGIYSYTYSITYYFMIFSMLGINNYGNRVIAKLRGDKEELSKNFLSIYCIQLVMSFIMLFSYFLYCLLFANQYEKIAFIQIIYLSSCIFNIEWFFSGLEKFKIISISGIGMKILSIFLIFLFVKQPNDLWIYTIILSVCSLLEKLVLFVFLKKEITFSKINFEDIKKHIKPCLLLFIPVISVGIYKQMDKIMLGMIGNVTEVGYYEQAEKIISTPMSIVIALGAVMLPKISNLVVKNKQKLIMIYIQKTIELTMFLIFPICFGLIAISSDFVLLLLGADFAKASILVKLLSFSTLFISFASVIRRQYLIPFEKDKVFIISVVVGAISNFIINLILMPKYLSIGACIGTLIAEFLVMIIQTIYVSKKIPIFKYFNNIVGFFYKSIIMFVCVLLIKRLELEPFLTVLLQVVLGIFIYLLLNIRYINRLFLKKH